MDEGNILTLDDPDLAMFPIAYMSEPGFWTMGEEEMEGLRGYLQKGGFIIFDDFRDNHRDNLIAQMQRVLPGATWRPLDVTHPIFHSFFEINSLDVEGYYGQVEWTGIFEDNDPAKRLLAVANYNHDLGELWEFSDTGYRAGGYLQRGVQVRRQLRRVRDDALILRAGRGLEGLRCSSPQARKPPSPG